MKKAVITTGGKQYLVAEGDELDVEIINSSEKSTDFEPLLVFDGEKASIGSPSISGSKVTADILDQSIPQPKVTSIRYKAKKRIHKIRGHRQKQAKIKIKSIK